MANLYRMFKDLLPEEPLLVGDIVSVQEGGKYIQLPTGGLILARGIGNLGERVFVRGGVIEGPAPIFTVEEIEF